MTAIRTIRHTLPIVSEIFPQATERVVARYEMPDPLRDDIRLLGGLLGTILKEAGGQDLLDDVEHLRELTIRAYGDDAAALAAAAAHVNSLSLDRADQIARAFTCYFHLANLAEEYHRVRVLRSRDQAVERSLVEETIPRAFNQLAEEVGRDEALRRLQELEFRPVLTAHPTEARRRAVSRSIRRIGNLLADRDTLRPGGTALAEINRHLLAEIDVLWRTQPLRPAKPTVIDEVKSAVGVFDQTLFQTFPEVYRRLDDWLLGDDAGRATPLVRPFVRLGTWIGGDRDGNPNVTADVTRQAAAVAAEHALAALEDEAFSTARKLTMAAGDTPPSDALRGLWNRLRQLSGEAAARAEAESPGEPHRAALLVIAERIAATRRRDADLAYPTAEKLEADLRVVQDSLVAAGAPRLAYGSLQKLIWQVQTFGFHLAELEVRQHSQVHAEALAEIAEKGVNSPELSDRTREVLDTYRALGAVQARYGERAARRYIVSFTQAPEHLAAVYQLAELAFPDPDERPVIDAIPLFETFADLEGSVEILEAMLELPQVQARLAVNGRKVEVMLGYSDSSKDVGPVAATLALHTAQSRIAEWADRHDIELTLFHGRGGALGRGGGPANRAVLAQPPHSVDGRFKLTEQGEVILARYGDPVIAMRHIEQVAAATLLASAPSVEKRNASATERFRDLASALDVASRERFHALVRSEGFPQWFAQVTPLEEIGMLAIGSRPAKRGLSVNSLDDLRAIPWVFSWSQARINLAGWYGLGTALRAYAESRPDGLAELQSAFLEWPLFNTLLDNVEMSIAKTDERIAQLYLQLGDRPDLAQQVLDELRLTREWVLKVTGNAWPLEGRRVLGRAVQLRSPYVDALSLLQVRALRALRTDGASEPSQDAAARRERWQHLLLLTVNGVSAGLQNTG
ncbi:Phosphoenolpyruvate carboxylase [Xylanimonas cellulosilytica DSM 15894]|uniref:Phosphoenolpyruvate carboxylase n=1 Tax=Xylanimonas cellulosilytica (strain DSM 15894 / JCM 12276 / CECT 5975 / KCTC 9989 / LMG 20990 / NBRC 107835 / XIL07) TaxID=446471 RepID=D1BRL9_XYLCX|nr:Phosphoenolpyruvate carboxylase [Xylanimonas cellulosilytica DSM 15894]